MNTSKSRIITTALALFVLVLLAINFILIGEIKKTRNQGKKWEMSSIQLSRQLRNLEKDLKRKSVPPLEPEKSKPDPKPRPQEKRTQEDRGHAEPIKKEDDYLNESIPELLSWGIEEAFPDLNLSEMEFEELTTTVLSIRESMQGLRALKRTGENAEAINRTRERLDQTMDDFERITGMSLTQFMRRAPTIGGIDNEKTDDEEIHLEYLSSSVQ
jgi:hypothetical protein